MTDNFRRDQVVVENAIGDLFPEALPVISKGSHQSAAQGACVMEYVSMLAGEPFSEYPKCTHRALARAAIAANDALPDDRRHEMVSRINRLFGTNTAVGEESKRISVGLANFSAAHAKKSAYASYAASYASSASYAASYAAYTAYTAYTASARLQFLDDLLDEYDRLTGRTEFDDVACQLPSIAQKVGV